MIVIINLAAVIAAAQVAPPALTLDQALAIADKNAFSIRTAASNVEKGKQSLSVARASLSPKLSVGSTYTRYKNESAIDMNGVSIVTQPIDNTTGTASVQMPIDISGNLHRQISASKHQLQATREQAAATTNDVHQTVRRAFFQVLRAKGLVEVADAALKNAKERASTNEKLYHGDQIARVDLQRIQAQVSQSESDLISAQNTLELAKNSFNFSIGRDIETPVELADVASLPTVGGDANTLVSSAQASRPEVKALNESLIALEKVRRATESGMNPSLTMGINYSRNFGSTGGFGSQTETTVGTLTLSVPIWDAGTTRDRVKSARQDELQAKINLEQVKLAISQEVRTAIANLSSAKARLDAATHQVELAEEVLRLANIRQEAGEGTYLEVVDAQTSLTQARNQAVSARYDYLTAYADVQHALGTDELPKTVTNGGAK